MHVECLSGDVFGSTACRCGRDLDAAVAAMKADGTYAAWNETTYYVGVWSASRGRLAITERAVVWDGGCEHYSPPRREEFEGLKVSGGRLTAGRLTMRRAE